MSFQNRNQAGSESEQHVRAELEQRGWLVHPWGRSGFPDAINAALSVWKDTYKHPCRLRWLPDFLVMRPNEPQTLQAVDVKRHRGAFDIERSALNTYSALETEMWLPVLIVFHCPQSGDEDDILRVIPAGECMISGIPKHGNAEFSSGTPFFLVDRSRMSSMDAIFGAKL
jgi:hypothetical protein